VKQVRQELLDQGRPLLDQLVREILGVAIRSLHADISTRTGERVVVVTLEQKPDLDPSEWTNGRRSESRRTHPGPQTDS
jgi:uncharacterized protein YbcI